MENKINELRKMATILLAADNEDETAARKRWGENVRDLLQELSIYHFELEHQNASLEQSEHDLAESRAKYVELFENAPVGYVLIDKSGCILQANRTFSELCIPRFPRDLAAEGRNFLEFVTSEYQEAFRHFLGMLSKPGSVLPMELKLIDAGGKSRYTAVTAGAWKSTDTLYRLTVSDIHSRKKLEMQLLAAKAQADENDHAKSLFLTRLNHELRTPLSVLSGFCEMLSDPNLAPDIQKTYVTTLQDVICSMRVIADEITDLSMLNTGMRPLRYEPVDVGNICKEHVRIAQNLVRGKGVLLECVMEKIPILVGDPARIETVIHSILRHTVENASNGIIRMNGRYDQSPNGSGMLSIELSGPGCGAANFMEMNSNNVDCAGIELFLARRVLSFMNGTLSIDSEQNMLFITIPLLLAPVSMKDSETSLPEKPQDSGPKTCLIVDDVPMNLKVLAALMRKAGCMPVMANSGKEALLLLARSHVDLILTDLWMPQMNGLKFAMNVRQRPQYNDIPLVAVTADVERTENFDMRIFADTLLKPVDLATLKKTLAAVWNNKSNNE